MTPEEKAAELLTLNADKAQNDSWLLPVDLEQRIAQALREAKIEAYEEAAQVLDQYPMAADYAPDILALIDSLVSDEEKA